MVNPFWKDILNDWISFCNSIDIEKNTGYFGLTIMV